MTPLRAQRPAGNRRRVPGVPAVVAPDLRDLLLLMVRPPPKDLQLPVAVPVEANNKRL